MKKDDAKADQITAQWLGLSYQDFVYRRALLLQQAQSQRPGRRKMFRFVVPHVSKVVTRIRKGW